MDWDYGGEVRGIQLGGQDFVSLKNKNIFHQIFAVLFFFIFFIPAYHRAAARGHPVV